MEMPSHIGIIMDGNGRWAQRHGLPRSDGHLEGLKTARRIVEAANRLKIRYLTLYVFSTENWRRTESEVRFILGLIKRYLVAELENYRKDRLRVRHAGDISRLPNEIAAEINKACKDTENFDGMQVILAINYGGRDEIVRAVKKIIGEIIEQAEIANQTGRGGQAEFQSVLDEEFIRRHLDNPDVPDPDLIIRTAGEFRTSNFLLWEGAYSEYFISPELWPDWTEENLKEAIAAYSNRDRRFGGRVDAKCAKL